MKTVTTNKKVKNAEGINPYQNAKEIIADHTNFTVKNLQTFNGHDGVGIDAEIYHLKNRIAHVHDGAYGGPLEITYLNFDNKKNKYDNYVALNGDNRSSDFVKNFLKNLPKYSWKNSCEADMSEERIKKSGITFDDDDYLVNKEWDDEHLFNEIVNNAIQKRELKKLLKKCTFLDDNNEIRQFNIPHSQKEKLFRIEGEITTVHKYCVNKGYILLNSLNEKEAFELYLNSIK